MANLDFCDSFSHYAIADAFTKYDYGTTYGAQLVSPGPLGVGSYLLANSGVKLARIFRRGTTLKCSTGMRFRVPSDTNSSFTPGQVHWHLQDANGYFLGGFTVSLDGSISWVYNDTTASANNAVRTTTAATPPGVLSIGQWQYIEIAVTLSGTGAGTIEIHVQNNQVLLATNVTTMSQGDGANHVTGPAAAAVIGDPTTPNGGARDYSDYMLYPGILQFKGDSQVGYSTVQAEGSVDQFGSSTGNPNWQNVNNVPADGDASYNFGSASGTEDAYASSAFPYTTGDIFGFQLVTQARKDSSGSSTLKLGLSNGSTTDFAPTQFPLNDTYRFLLVPYDQNPLTSADLAPADFATLQLVDQIA